MVVGTAVPCPYGWHVVTAVPCPYGWRPLRYRLCALCGHGGAVPLRWARGHGGAVPLRWARGHGGAGPLRVAFCASTPLRLCALCAFALASLCPSWAGGHGDAVPLRGAFVTLTPLCPLPFVGRWARRCRAPTGGARCVNPSVPFALRGQVGTAMPCPYGWRSLRLCVTVFASFVGTRARRGRAPTGGVLCVNTFACFALLCAFALTTFALTTFAPFVGRWARRYRAPTGGARCVNPSVPFALRGYVGTAPPCPYGWRSVRQHLCAFAPFAPLR
ncbi:MAG: hypothetical protein KatS3mg055_2477 [Chloroflexus sp.]|nr:MAG: hypothetical protein KatS3mg055_2477 [Chloroflexus sp.]